MDFHPIIEEIADNVNSEINSILSLNISPDEKVRQISLVLGTVGRDFGDKMAADISYGLDADAITTTIESNVNDQVQVLALKIVRDNALGKNDFEIIREYYNTVLARVEYQIFKNAGSLGKNPTLTRTMTGWETCDWCRKLVGTYSAATFTDIPQEAFQRHDGCDCRIVLSGGKIRRQELQNYKKKES